MACSSCGTEMAVGQLFCRECGARTEGQAKPNYRSLAKGINNRALGAIGSLYSRAKSSKAIEEGVDKVLESGKQASKRFTNALSEFINKRKKLLIIVGLSLGISSAYAVIQMVMLNQNGPQTVAAKVVAAANSRDYDALMNETLFPNPNNYPYLDASLIGIYSDRNLEVGDAEFSLFSDTAFVAINDEITKVPVTQIKLTAKNSWNFIFYQREWQIVSDAPTVKFSTSTLGKNQKLQLGDITFDGSLDPELLDLTGTPYVSFPGIVSIETADFGFEQASTDEVSVGDSSTSILSATQGDLYFPISVESLATTKADATASWCASSECSMLPYFSNSDYFWDSDPDWDLYYDYTYSSDAFTSRGCTLTSSTPNSETNGVAYFSCEIYGAKATVHVVEYYYLSDDYTYFNGTATKYMNLRVNVSFNPSTGKFRATSDTY